MINFYLKKSKNINRRIVSVVLTISLIIAPVFLVSAPQTKAHGPVTVVGGIGTVQETLSAVSNALTAGSVTSLAFKENVLDPIAWFVAKAIINGMTASIVDWINSGFNGNPAFVTDLRGFLLDIADAETGLFIEELGLTNLLCSPWSLDVRIALALPRGQFQRRVACTLSDVVANMDDFINGDFSQGGWAGWFELTTKPQNNPYGLYLMSASELDQRIASTQQEQTKLLDFGRGFLSYEKCEAVPVAGPPGPDGSTPTREICEIVTPGSVIENQLESVLGSGVRQLELADEFNEIISALLTQLVYQLGSPGGLRRASVGGGITSQLRSASSGTDLTSIKNNMFIEIDKEINGETDYRNVKQITLDAILASENLLLNLQACYAGKLSDSDLNLTESEKSLAQTRINDALSTITTQITPTKTLLDNAVAVSDQNLVKLNEIRTNVTNATSPSEVQIYANNLITLRQSGVLHSSNTDIFYAQQEQTTVTAQMSALNATTNAQITECQNFPQSPQQQNP